MKLKDKIAVITGASSGLGSAIAAALIQKGAIVFGLARNITALNQLKNQLGDRFFPVEMDITHAHQLKNWVQKTFHADYIPHILINNAGTGGFAAIDQMAEDDWLTMTNTNMNGMYYVTSSIVPLMKVTKESKHIINIGSILGTMGREEGSAYCATKHAVVGFSDALFKELRHFNIKVTCFNPGSIETDFFKTSGIDSHSNMLHPSDLADIIVHVLETPENVLINEMTVRPLNPKKPL